MLIRSIAILLLLLTVVPAFAKEKPVSLVSHKTVYTIYFDKKSGDAHLIESVSLEFEAKRSHATAFFTSFYNESSFIRGTSAFNERNKRFDPEVVCGNYEDNEIFYSDAKLCTYKIPIEEKGGRRILQHYKEYTNLRYFTSVYFPYVYDVAERIVEFHIPDWVDMELKEFNFPGDAIAKKEWVDKKKKNRVVQYRAENLLAFEDGPFLPGKSHTYPHIVPVIKGYSYKNNKTSLMASTADLYLWYASLVESVENSSMSFAEKVTEITSGKAPGKAQIEAIYYWVQDNIRYIAFEDGIAGFKPEASQQVYQKRYGDCKGMANLTKEMLKLAGYDARLSWIGTNTLAYTYDTPSLVVDNHMICVVYHEGDTLILDATEKFIGLNDLAERIQGKEMMVENGQSYNIQKVPELTALRNKKITSYDMVLNEDVLMGKGNISLRGEQRTSLLYHCNNVRNLGSENLIKRFIIGESKNFVIADMVYSALDEREKPFEIDFSFELNNKISAYGKELYWQPDPSPEYSNLKMEKGRINDLYFNEKIDQLTEVALSVPKGYKVSFLPEDFKKESEEFNISLSFVKKGNKILYRRHIRIPSGRVSVPSFEAWNEALDGLGEKYKEQIILTKQ